ncbi:MAG: hypothetical protein D6731_14725 [Planctomycetota bacterium]|nr:MAG: hypothetical protein D6731_14725 [Planctomycetota bacterium]
MAESTLRSPQRRRFVLEARLKRLRAAQRAGVLSAAAVEAAAYLDDPAAVALRRGPVLAPSPEARALIDLHLAGLPFRERELLRLRRGWADGNVYSPEEIGRVFGLAPDAVRARCEATLRRLRAALLLEELLGCAETPSPGE